MTNLFPEIPYTQTKEEISATRESFLKSYMDNYLHNHLDFLGIKIVKNPFDLMIFQEIIHRLRPDNIIETGGGFGGSAFFYANMMDLLGLPGKVFTTELRVYDLTPTKHLQKLWERVVYIEGAMSFEYKSFQTIKKHCAGKNNLVFLDSCHEKPYVVAEMEMYAKMVQPGGYMIIEDTCLSGHPARGKYESDWEGPWEAVDEFLSKRDDFVIDESCERLLFTCNPRGYLRRIK